MSDEQDFYNTENATGHFLDNEPVIFLGCSQGELFATVFLSYTFWLLVLLIIFITFIDDMVVAIALPCVFALILMIPTFMLACKSIAKNKRGKPNGYFSLQIKLTVDSMKALLGVRPKFNRFTGIWSKSRSV